MYRVRKCVEQGHAHRYFVSSSSSVISDCLGVLGGCGSGNLSPLEHSMVMSTGVYSVNCTPSLSRCVSAQDGSWTCSQVCCGQCVLRP